MPCSPGMTACKASCLHRQFVNGYQDERRRQVEELIERNKGWDTEIADELRVRREQGNPLVTYQQWMIQSKREAPVEMAEVVYPGNQMAEESLLAIAMREPRGVAVLRQLGPEEFQTPLNREIATAIIDLEDHGHRATPLAVEDYLQQSGYPSGPEWDSRFDQGSHLPADWDRTQHGLHRWAETAGVYDNALVFADEIRLNYQAYQTERITTWGQQTMRGIQEAGLSPERVEWLNRQITEQMGKVKPALPQQNLGPAQDWNKAQSLSRPASLHSPIRTTMTTSRRRA